VFHLDATSYTWQFGDGSTLTTASPGAAYPELQITHEYLKKGDVAPRVDVTWGGRYQVDGGRWRQLRGSATVEGEPTALQIVTATPALVGY
jgi:hypothetical protein